MAVQITIRGVPDAVRDRLAQRATDQGQSMQRFLRDELERIAARPAVGKWLEDVRKHKAAAQRQVTAASILRARDMDRV